MNEQKGQAQPIQPQEAISIQAVWQVLGQKEWALQMAMQQAAVLQQRLTEALTKLAVLEAEEEKT